MYGYILSLVPDWNDADEILQETCLRLWERFDAFEPGTDFGAWACTIAKFQVLTFRKTKSRNKLLFSDEFINLVAAEQNTQAELLDSRRTALERCIEKLSERNRQLLRSCYESNTTIAQVAKQIGRTAEATYKALQRIRATLHDCIDRRLSSEGGGR